MTQAQALLVRDLMTIGVPVCRTDEMCAAVAERLRRQRVPAEVVVALDEDGIACGWLGVDQLGGENSARPVEAVMDEDIPTVPPDIPASAALQIMVDRNLAYVFLMHDWPGEPRPSAVLSRRRLESRIGP